MSDLNQPLLDKDEKAESFSVSRQELIELFETENRINDKGGVSESCKKIEELGNSEGLLKALDTSEDRGIEMDDKKIKEREKAFGNNERREAKSKGICEMIMEQFDDKILRILILAAFVSL
jgi:magnesium-transporting ATPase (P-type)